MIDSHDHVPCFPGKWTCSVCKKKFDVFRLFKDIVAGKYGICVECQNVMINSDPDLKWQVAVAEAHINVTRVGKTDVERTIDRFNKNPSWWSGTLPKSWIPHN